MIFDIGVALLSAACGDLLGQTNGREQHFTHTLWGKVAVIQEAPDCGRNRAFIPLFQSDATIGAELLEIL
ncbi:MAG: hypothetical protein ABJO54_07385 [Hyphomicrobiales bacterium]